MNRFSVFPVGPDKAPLIKDWQSKATQDPETIARWIAQGVKAFGIPCGAANDLFVIDLDVDKATGEQVGRDSLLSMPRYAALYDHAYVMTPSGGRHIYLRHFEGARNSVSKIGLKIDTRGEGGYVVAPGSQVTDGFYVGSIPETLPSVPFGLRAMLMQPPAAPGRPSQRNASVGEVEDLLSHIPADLNYGEWLSVLMALHDKYEGSEEGFGIADRWSATGAKYRAGEVQAKWQSFKREGVSWATIPAMARRHGADLSEIARRHAQ